VTGYAFTNFVVSKLLKLHPLRKNCGLVWKFVARFAGFD
jgi:hypothetical protein